MLPDDPYASPESGPPPRSPSTDPSVEHEPHLRGGPAELDPSEQTAAELPPPDEESRVEHSVWDEPALDGRIAPPPGDTITYARWLATMRRETTPGRSWAVCLLVALAAGPWAILGALLGAQVGFGVVLVVVVGPLTEEVMKIAIPLWIVEKRPYLFRSPIQLLVCALAGGLMFAVIENLMYLNVYVPHPSPELVRWRWTICTALHATCSLIAGIGLWRVWSQTISHHTRPQLSPAARWLAAAVILHGAYNAAAVWLSVSEHKLF